MLYLRRRSAISVGHKDQGLSLQDHSPAWFVHTVQSLSLRFHSMTAVTIAVSVMVSPLNRSFDRHRLLEVDAARARKAGIDYLDQVAVPKALKRGRA